MQLLQQIYECVYIESNTNSTGNKELVISNGLWLCSKTKETTKIQTQPPSQTYVKMWSYNYNLFFITKRDNVTQV